MNSIQSKRRMLFNFTITELILLLLFLVLIITGVMISRLQQENKNLESTLAQLQEDNTTLQELKDYIKDTIGEGEFTKAQIDELARKLVLATGLKIDNKKLKEELAQLIKENEEKLGKYDYYKKKAETLGAGLPPCWPRSNDVTNPEYLFDVDITDQGIILFSTDKRYPHRVEDRKQLPVQNLVTDSALSLDDFLSQTMPVFSLSERKECRHYVLFRDLTGNDKQYFKNMMETINARFYNYENK